MKSNTALISIASVAVAIAALLSISRPQGAPTRATGNIDSKTTDIAHSDCPQSTILSPSDASDETATTVARRILFISDSDADALGISKEQRARLTNLSAKALMRLLMAIARNATFSPSGDTEITIGVDLPSDAAVAIEEAFWSDVAETVGQDIRHRFATNPDALARLEKTLLDFGKHPFAISYRSADSKSLKSADRIEWAHVLEMGSQLHRAVVVSGTMSRQGILEVYGPVADRALN